MDISHSVSTDGNATRPVSVDEIPGPANDTSCPVSEGSPGTVSEEIPGPVCRSTPEITLTAPDPETAGIAGEINTYGQDQANHKNRLLKKSYTGFALKFGNLMLFATCIVTLPNVI